MASSHVQKRRKRAGTLQRIETDPGHHLAGGMRPQTPLNVQSTMSTPRTPTFRNPQWSTKSQGLWADIKSLRWVVVPASSLKLLLLVVVLWANWEFFTPFVAPGAPNPFTPMIFISHPVQNSPAEDPRYQKGYLDIVFMGYYIVFWSFVRQSITINLCRPIARYFGIKKEGKLDRFGEQGYAMLYFAFTGLWGLRIMSQLPTWWYRTEYFWIDYPHWDMKPELKRYYLMQAAYWCQQLIVLVLKLEKPRSDYHELVAHHFVTLWLVGWSYIVNLTLIGNAVYLSMDIPDMFLALSKLLNYIEYERTKVVTFVFFIGIWSYFRHYLNLVMLWSVWNEFDLIPETSKRWQIEDGIWLVWWMKYQIFLPILLLQCLNLFWYYLIWRLAYRAVFDLALKDSRSDDEDDGEDDGPEEKED